MLLYLCKNETHKPHPATYSKEMELIDTHSHKYLREFENNWDTAIERAKKASVSHICIPNVDETSIEYVLALAEQYPGYCLPMMGLHPTSVTEDYKNQLKTIEEQLAKHTFVAIGEIGVDLYWDKSLLKQQLAAFEHQLALAEQHNLPVNIHVRDAFPETFGILDQFGSERIRGILHCFSGTLQDAQRAINMGLKLGIGGVVTFKKSPLADVVAQLPIEELVLETDAPFLAPAPHRGKTNESSYIIHIAEKIAELHHVSLSEVATITTANAKNIFAIK